MVSTLHSDARHHQTTLQTTMQAFIKLVKSDNHEKSHYWDYIKGMKFVLDSHVPQLQGWEPKDIVKMIKTMIQDLKCKYLHPSESTEASSSDEGMPQKFDTLSEANIMVTFSKDMLTPEVRMNISNVIEHMKASHTEAAEAMQCMKKLVMTIPVGTFCLMLQAMVQPHIMIQCWWLCHIRSGEEEKHLHSFTGRYGSRWIVVSKSTKSCQNSCCNITLSA